MPTLSPRASFWTAASVAGIALWSAAAPTIVYPLYEHSWGLSAATSTLIFAIYPIVLIPTLLIFGNLSDSRGRRFAILLGLGALALGTLTFGIAAGLPEVLIGRALMGVGVGMSLSPATAAMVELGGPERAPRASSTMTAATAAGLAFATIVGGALVQYAPQPLHLTFWVLLVVILAIGAAAVFLPRVRDRHAPAWRPRLPRVPAGLRRAFVAGALGVSAAYAVGSVFLALGAQVAADLLHSSNALLNGTILAISAICIGVVAIAARRILPRVALGIAPAAILLGMASLVAAGIAQSMPMFVIASVLTGGGYSLMYAGGLGIITSTAQPHHRAAVISAAFTVGYLVQAAVALVLGAVATSAGLLIAMELAAAVLVALAVAAALVANVHTTRPSARSLSAKQPSKGKSVTSLDNAVVLVTGANGGLGIQFVTQALARGARRVYATARSPRDWDDQRVVPLVLDVTSTTSIREAAVHAGDTMIVVNNAGIGGAGPLLDSPLDDVRRLFDTNVFGALEVAQVFAPVLAVNGGGALVDVHSALSWLGRGGAYAATKAAFWSLTNSLRLELQAQGTHVLGAHLGYADTPMTAALDVIKENPADIVAAIYDGLEAGELEVLADETSRQVKAALSQPILVLYPEFAPR